jgi:hypothetical protein
MARDLDELRTRFIRDGGVIVRMEWLNPDGSFAYGTDDKLVCDLFINDRRVAWMFVDELRPTAQDVKSIERQSDEWFVLTMPGNMQLVVGPLWTQELRDQAAEYARTRASRVSPQVLEDLKLNFSRA